MGKGLITNLEKSPSGQDKLGKAIERASSEIDGYLVSGGYEVPLSFVPPNIQNYAVDFAVYNFAVAVGLTDDKAAEELREKAKVAREFLRLVGQRKLSIPTGGTDSSGASGTAGGGEHSVQVKRGVSRVNMRGYL